jgi:transcriptional regulator with XRE-family HTH domain
MPPRPQPRPHRSHPAPRARRHLTALPDPTAPQQPSQTTDGAFSPGRLRAYRDLYGYTRVTLAIRVGISADTLTAYEQGAAIPDTATLTTLAAALNVDAHAFTGQPGADDSWEYWGLICAAMPPMTEDQIATVATVLRRIDKHHHPANDPATKRPRAA